MTNRSGLENVVLEDPQEQRVPCVLLLDTSGSMNGGPIRELNEALIQFRNDLERNVLAKKRAEVAVITFGQEVRIVQEFTRVDEGFDVPTLMADGSTPMGQALLLALDEIEDRKKIYRNNGIQYTRPWLFLITDGAPTDTDAFNNAVQRVTQEQQNKKVLVFPIGVKGANVAELKRLNPEFTLILKSNFSFGDLFAFFSSSIANASSSKPGEQVQLGDVTIFQAPL